MPTKVDIRMEVMINGGWVKCGGTSSQGSTQLSTAGNTMVQEILNDMVLKMHFPSDALKDCSCRWCHKSPVLLKRWMRITMFNEIII